MSTFTRIKRLLTVDGGGGYECLTCNDRFDHQYQVCPECGGYDIRRVEWLDAEDRPSEERV